MAETKVAVVTGASRGIGKAIALKLAQNGFDIIVNYNNSADLADAVVAQIEAMGQKALAVQADVSDFTQAKTLADTAKEAFGQVDVLVNNAGITRDGLLIRMKEEDFDTVIEANLKSAFNCMRHITPLMVRKRKGCVINIVSIAGVVGNAAQVNYAASKAGMIGMTKSVAKELASRNIRANAIAPGLIETDMTNSMDQDAKEYLLSKVPLGRMGKVEEIAALVAYLASDDAAYITGQVITIDGGMTM